MAGEGEVAEPVVYQTGSELVSGPEVQTPTGPPFGLFTLVSSVQDLTRHVKTGVLAFLSCRLVMHLA